MNLSEQAYHDYPAWSYSLIAKYARNGFSAIATLHDKMKPTPEMEFGSLFDSILTKGRKTLDDYAVADFSVPPAEKGVLDKLADNCTCPQFHDISMEEVDRNVRRIMEEVVMTSDAVGYQPKWKPQTRYDHIAEHSGYYDAVKSGKKLVSQKDWDDAVEMARIFRSDPYLRTIFGTKNTNEVEYIYQPQFCVSWIICGEEVKVKCMFDLLVVNHKDKTIQPVDLKTSSMPAYDFPEHFVKMRYDIQAGLYTRVLQKVVEQDDELQYYTILPFLFTDVSRTDKVPVTYEIAPSNGFSFSKGEKVYDYKGWEELLAEILVYEENESKVPNYVTTDGPNDRVSILSR